MKKIKLIFLVGLVFVITGCDVNYNLTIEENSMTESVDFLYDNGAKAVHMRSACPPIMYGCKFLNFSRGRGDMELLARRIIQELEGDEGQNT